jgi:hypothetical protein
MKNKTPSQCSGWGFCLLYGFLKKLKIKTIRYKKGAIAAPF